VEVDNAISTVLAGNTIIKIYNIQDSSSVNILAQSPIFFLNKAVFILPTVASHVIFVIFF